MSKIQLEAIKVRSFVTTKDIEGGREIDKTGFQLTEFETIICCTKSMIDTACTGPVCL